MAKKAVKETKPKKSTKKKAIKFDGEVKEMEIDLSTGKPRELEVEDTKAILDSFKARKYSHFDIINSMLKVTEDGNGKTYPPFSYYTKEMIESNYFMVNRTLAIKYPLQAQAFNLANINKYEAMLIWCKFLQHFETIGKTPSFVYTRMAKGTENTSTHNMSEFDSEVIVAYCKRYRLSLNDLKDMFFFFPNETYDDIENYRIMHDKKEQAKRFIQKEK